MTDQERIAKLVADNTPEDLARAYLRACGRAKAATERAAMLETKETLAEWAKSFGVSV
ncbi:hypothetical protein [Limimaricola cinnabarinus]|uniref:hypothetical protein n=1 Tax=Limimaricola cinnabarinus TaxID=1125964 RepID=UPI00248FBAAF|nr:hypothetical protein [Limimaricola cinnabarinus]